MSAKKDGIFSLLTCPPVLNDGKIKCEQVYFMFTDDNTCSYVVILEDLKPIGLITRTHFMLANSGAFGYSLHQKRPAINTAIKDFLIVPDTQPIPEIASSAMHRTDEHIYDPVVVVDSNGAYLGCIEIKSLLLRSSQLEIELAKNANPLTGLPGNKQINHWITEALGRQHYHIIYGDLSNFKEYNDTYGFNNGDKVIRLAARIMQKHQEKISPDARVGHIGGDDYIIVADDPLNNQAIEEICRDFDQQVQKFFKPEHIKNGIYEAKNREGKLQLVPLTTLSLSVISANNFKYPPHIAEIAKAAASLKKVAKIQTVEFGCSCVVYERRVYTCQCRP